MRALLPALALALGMSIGPANADEQLAAALERTGFFTGLDRAQTAALRAEIVGQGYTAAMQRARRVANAQPVANLRAWHRWRARGRCRGLRGWGAARPSSRPLCLAAPPRRARQPPRLPGRLY